MDKPHKVSRKKSRRAALRAAATRAANRRRRERTPEQIARDRAFWHWQESFSTALTAGCAHYRDPRKAIAYAESIANAVERARKRHAPSADLL